MFRRTLMAGVFASAVGLMCLGTAGEAEARHCHDRGYYGGGRGVAVYHSGHYDVYRGGPSYYRSAYRGVYPPVYRSRSVYGYGGPSYYGSRGGVYVGRGAAYYRGGGVGIAVGF
ncbi:hypothetical protein Mal64_20290 [Pseudobythopirellula maris]|uniref:Uncharacterized protein n=1 Tax=Pseudobythopirellula maris TaxID=2527991 RepID=A0A5C5ZN67_9BACT|nr:hypothetical protein [Pseudobythopirellula maris]TWT88546.1 hypothetical protein Mal64_20290 [Pseudobythopirellula maris]